MKRCGLLCFLIILLLPAREVQAEKKTAKATKITLNKTETEVLPGKSCQLKAKVTPKKAAAEGVVWSSSNEKVATVSKKGKVKVKGLGTAKITAKTTDGKKAVCKVTGVQYLLTKDYVKIATEDGVKKYRRYKQLNSTRYLYSMGCVQTGLAIVASAYDKSWTPQQIHTGSASSKYSERYALGKMKVSTGLYDKAAISLATASQILTDMGISNKPVYKFNASSAVKQIRKHVKTGKPVLVKVNNRNVNGIRMANGHHTMVLIGLDPKDNVICIDPWNGDINYAHGSGRYFQMKLENFVKNHMYQAAGGAFVTSSGAGGGYILIG